MRSVLALVLALAARADDTCESAPDGSLESLRDRLDNSLIRELSVDPDAAEHTPNQRKREVHSGHFVPVAPQPLPEPYLVACSEEAAALLGLDAAECMRRPFARLFSGDLTAAGFEASWATPYALSIYGSAVVPNGAGASGNGYGRRESNSQSPGLARAVRR
jgi:hypothetical protein